MYIGREPREVDPQTSNTRARRFFFFVATLDHLVVQDIYSAEDRGFADVGCFRTGGRRRSDVDQHRPHGLQLSGRKDIEPRAMRATTGGSSGARRRLGSPGAYETPALPSSTEMRRCMRFDCRAGSPGSARARMSVTIHA